VCEVKFDTLKLLHPIKCICTRTIDIKPFLLTVIVFVLFIYFAIKLEDTPSAERDFLKLAPKPK